MFKAFRPGSIAVVAIAAEWEGGLSEEKRVPLGCNLWLNLVILIITTPFHSGRACLEEDASAVGMLPCTVLASIAIAIVC